MSGRFDWWDQHDEANEDKVCPTCKGTEEIKCEECDGEGVISIANSFCLHLGTTDQVCDACNGRMSNPCPDCQA